MRFKKYSSTYSIGFNDKNQGLIIKVISIFRDGTGNIYYKDFLDKKIIKTIKYILFYINIDFSKYDLYINIKPNILKKIETCLDLSFFFSIFLSFFNINLKEKILILGKIDLNSNKICSIGNLTLKIKISEINKINFLIIPKNSFFNLKKNKISILKFEYIYEIFFFLKKCLSQKKNAHIITPT